MTFHSMTGLRPAQRIVRPGGAYGWLTPFIMQMTDDNSDVAARALSLERGETHFIALCVSLMGDKACDTDHFRAFARSYGGVARRLLLMEAARLGGARADPALARIAFNLAGRLWRPAAYRRLATLTEEPTAAKTLRHLRRVTRRQVATLARLPGAYRTCGVLKLVRRNDDMAEMLFAIELVRRVRTDLDDRQIVASLEKARSRDIRDWVMRHYERMPFPAAPTAALVIAGVEVLRPLCSYGDLARTAREFDNCVRNYLWTVLKGDSYFYRYQPQTGGKGVAVVELRRVPALGWVVHEALGPRNASITGVDRAAILAAFRAAGVGAAPQARSPSAWFDIS